MLRVLVDAVRDVALRTPESRMRPGSRPMVRWCAIAPVKERRQSEQRPGVGRDIRTQCLAP
eukprot:6082150-Prymnesium_polylepis.1